MKYYLSDLLPRLKKFSAKLDQTSFLVDKPWVVSSDQGAYEKLIFRRDGRVHLSSDGSVTDGKWEYLPEAQSLLIDYGDEKKLYNHQYLDEAVLALKQDGTSADENFFLLANENSIPDTDAEKYLRDKYLKENNVELVTLANGQELEVHKRTHLPNKLIRGEVKGNDESFHDGKYLLDNQKEKICITNGEVRNVLQKKSYPDGIRIWQNSNLPMKGEEVEGLEWGSFKINEDTLFNTYKIAVDNGKVADVKDIGMKRLLFTIILVSAIIVGLIILA